MAEAIKEKEAPSVPKEEPKEEMVQVSASVMKTLTDRLERLEKGEPALMDEEPRNRKATMRVWDKKLVVGWDQPKVTKKRDGDESMKWTIHLKNKDAIEKVEVGYLEFLREAERIEVEILKISTTNEVTYHGYTTVKEVDNYRTVDTGIKVPMKVTTKNAEAVVRLPTGHEIVVDVRYLNV